MLKEILITLLIITLKKTHPCKTLSDKHCVQCDLNDKCETCYKTYFDLTTKKCSDPTQKITNCDTYKSPTECGRCEFSYFLNDNKCEKIKIKNCATFLTSINKCETCLNKKLIAKSGFECSDKDCNISYCDLCSYSWVQEISKHIEICFGCAPGYALTFGYLNCVKNEENCYYLDEQGRCSICHHGKYFNGEKCEESDLIPNTNVFFTSGVELVFETLLFFFMIA